jgi:hypothetical protein
MNRGASVKLGQHLWAAYSTSQMGCIMHEKALEKANSTGKLPSQSPIFCKTRVGST